MSPEPTGVHGLLKQRKLFTHKHRLLSVLYLLSFYDFCQIVFKQAKEILNFYFSLRSRPVAHEILGVLVVIFVVSRFIFDFGFRNQV